MASVDPDGETAPAHEESVVLASFESRRVSEHTVMSFGHKFHNAMRRGRATVLVLSANPDGSLKLTQSRVQTAGNISAAVMRAAAAIMVGFLGVVSTIKGGRATARAARVHEESVGADEHVAHAILADAGAHSAIVLVRCQDHALAQDIRERAAHRAITTWSGSMTEFRSALDPGRQHDWVRAALAKSAGSGL
jgi:hypothetical protein